MSVKLNGSKPLIHCHAGCSQEAVIDALRERGLWREADRDASARPHAYKGEVIERWYDYRRADGALAYIVARTPSKQFPIFHPEGQGWEPGYGGARILYRLPELVAADPSLPVFVVEGEKDVETAGCHGLIATTTPGGAGKAHLCDLAPLQRRSVVIVPDKDAPGAKHADELVRLLRPITASVKRVDLPEISAKDLTDFFDDGRTAKDLTELIATAGRPPTPPTAGTRLKPGGTAILDTPTETEALWGKDDDVLMAMGEPNEIYGHTGTGKSTLGQQLTLASIGVREPLLLGLTVAPRKRWLYLALDRPAQIKRSLRRMVGEEHRALLDERLVIHDGPLDFDLAQEPDRLLAIAQEVGADAVMIDSLKDAAGDLEKTAGGQGVNRAHQLLVANGIEVVVLHHPRKAQIGNSKPKKIDDVYGSRFITDGMGSVILLWGEPGDAIVEMLHLKQPRDSVGPWTIIHDHETGTTTRADNLDAYQIIYASNGISAVGIARQLFKTDKPTGAQIENARRKAQSVVKRGLAIERPGVKGGIDGGTPALFFKIATTNSDHADHGANTDEIRATTRGLFSDTNSDHGTDHGDHGTDHESDGLYREPEDVATEPLTETPNTQDLEPCRWRLWRHGSAGAHVYGLRDMGSGSGITMKGKGRAIILETYGRAGSAADQVFSIREIEYRGVTCAAVSRSRRD